MTLTSPTYLIEVASTSTSGDGGTDVGPHTHTWSEHYEVKRHTTTENIIGYKCNNAKCGYSTENETLMIQHDRYNRAITPHTAYDSNVQIDTKVEDIIGYKCNGCDFVTEDYEAIHDHDWQNAPVAGHGGYDSNVQIGTAEGDAVFVCYRCNDCGMEWTDPADTELFMSDCPPHNSYTQLNETTWQCDFCGDEFDEGGKTAHQRAHTGTYSTITEGGSSPIYGYKCRGCSFTTQSEAEIKAHDAANQGKTGHGSFQRDVKIGTREVPIYGFVCKTCGHSTTDENAIKKHLADNPGQVGHGGYQSNVVIGTREVLLGATRERNGWYCCICGARTDNPY